MAKRSEINYFDSFVKGTEYALLAAQRLQILIQEAQFTEDKIAEIKKIEQDADTHMHTVCCELNVAFITPIDRDDIYKISKETDDIIDSIDSVASKIWMMCVTHTTPSMRTMSEYVTKACEVLVKLMSEVKHHKKSNKLNEYVIEINRIEEMGDRCYKEAIRELFESEKDPIELIKLKEVYRELEAALDNCEDVADCVQSIIITKT